jgi:hypothetical protein
MTVEERRVYWERCLAEQAVSGLSARAWCRQVGVAYGTFSYWRSRAQSESPVVPVRLIPVVDESPSRAVLRIMAGGACIEVGPEFDADLLRRVVAALSPC